MRFEWKILLEWSVTTNKVKFSNCVLGLPESSIVHYEGSFIEWNHISKMQVWRRKCVGIEIEDWARRYFFIVTKVMELCICLTHYILMFSRKYPNTGGLLKYKPRTFLRKINGAINLKGFHIAPMPLKAFCWPIWICFASNPLLIASQILSWDFWAEQWIGVSRLKNETVNRFFMLDVYILSSN